MKQLSGLDASFLYLETAEMPMHVGALHLFELPPSYRGHFLEDMRAHIAARLPLAPALRRRLAWMPLNLAAPAWVDADPDLEAHVVGITLPRGSDIAALEAQVGRLHPILLDRSRPLWKFHVFDGLTAGPNGEKRYALYTQLHHAAVDGQAAVALAQAILDLSPAGREIEARPARARKGSLAMTELLRGAVSHQLDQLGTLVEALPSAVGAISQVASQTAGGALGETASAMWSRLKGEAVPAKKGVSNLGLAPRTRLNTTISDTRAFATVTLPLSDFNAVRRRHGASLNDALMFVISGALRRHFGKHGPLPRKSLVAAVPISLRAKGDTSSNNQASMSLISLGTHLADPGKRLAHVMAASAAMKATIGSVKNLLPTDFPSMGVPWLMEALTAVYGRAGVADRIPPVANLVISNVPGPTVPLYMAGAKMVTNYPASIVVHGVALNVTVQTYNESLDIGVMACAEAMPEVAEFAAQIETAFEEFRALPVAAPAEPVAQEKKVVATKAPAKKAAVKKAAVKKSPAKKTAAKKSVAKATGRPRASAPTAKRASR
ncbi:MAG: wax ester/triacylglycerol synthase family O-acyltransferase [Burkholderiaceae bacterium]|nr:MAG: wax ester/triacylglycerol synthase family O-acyltransferase [Burkholderiaceae bacterium]